MKITKLLILGALMLALGSCMELETELSFRNENSGTLSLRYRIDSRALEIGMFDSDASILPLPLARRDFEQTAARHPDLKLRSYRMRRQDATTFIDAEYQFESIEALSLVFGTQSEVTVESTGGGTRFRHQLFDGFAGEPGERAGGFIDSFLSNGSFSMTVRAPRAISASSLGVTSDRTASVRYSAQQLLDIGQPLVWELYW